MDKLPKNLVHAAERKKYADEEFAKAADSFIKKQKSAEAKLKKYEEWSIEKIEQEIKEGYFSSLVHTPLESYRGYIALLARAKQLEAENDTKTTALEELREKAGILREIAEQAPKG